MKKKIFISYLLVSFFNYIGCYTYSSLREEEIGAGYPKQNQNIRLILSDSTKIDSSWPLNFKERENIYLKVDAAGNYVAGHGDIFDKIGMVKADFRGIIRNYFQ